MYVHISFIESMKSKHKKLIYLRLFISQRIPVTTIAGSAIDRAEGTATQAQPGQPARHLVSPGETAFSIARLYDVPVASLAEWNGLGADLALAFDEGSLYMLLPSLTKDFFTAAV